MRFWSVFTVATCVAVTIAACGSDDASTGGTFTGGMDASTGNLDGGPSLGDSSLGGDGSGHNTCTPKTCAQQMIGCGPAGDGCGNVIMCGSCTAPATCGGGGHSSQCGGDSGCVPKTCATANAGCGPAADGCGGLLQCGTCTAPMSCGGGGTASECGTPMGTCTALTCAQQNIGCGPAGDGCGGTLQCGTCTGNTQCGAGGTPGQCGTAPTPDGGSDAGNPCNPISCAQQNIGCGPAGDGCGNTLQCGTCVAPQTCGGGGTSSQCGGMAQCVPTTCQQLHYNCGPAGDGCGGTLQCGNCTAPQSCGGGGTASVCGGNNSCTPTTCAALGFNCGFAADGCGGLLQCGTTCTGTEICGGGGLPNVCGPTDAAVPCVGLCQQQTTCTPPTTTTTLKGHIYAPAAAGDPIYGALVYVPNLPQDLTQFANTVTCDQCGATASGDPLVSSTTDYTGLYTLTNVPVGSNIVVVVQLGRWRRVVRNVTVPSCATTTLDIHLPTKEAMGDPLDNIPRTAFVTGDVDSLECVLRKIGILDTEFGDPPATQTVAGEPRIQFYLGAGATIPAPGFAPSAGSTYNGTTPSETSLWASTANMEYYDQTFFACQGGQIAPSAAGLANVNSYAGAGGRVFATHYSYSWIYNNGNFSTTANWTGINGGSDDGYTMEASIDTVNNPTGTPFQNWLDLVTGQAQTNTTFGIQHWRHDITGGATGGLSSLANRWFYTNGFNDNGTAYPGFVEDYTFNTPVGAPSSQQCGRVLFSDFHVSDADSNGTTFPNECNTNALTSQEKALEFAIFNLASCIVPTVPPPPTCTPLTCAQQGIGCGNAGDGCGNEINCGTCNAPQTCGGGGTPNQCGGGCVPETCASEHITCGPAGNGCGGSLSCGNCTPPQTCGGGGVPGQCGAPTCTPTTCLAQNITCGPASNGCGGQLSCGTCTPPESCGGGGVPGQCGAPDGGSSCVPITCASQGITCGPAGDGCGNLIQCGTCVAPQTCGGGGHPGQCGAPSCVPTTCAEQMLSCGPAGDGCGGQLQCGTCTPPQTCGGGGTPGQCGMPNCTPLTCQGQGLNCGPAGDGCGGTLQCGTCTAPDTCGGGGTSGQCGSNSQPH